MSYTVDVLKSLQERKMAAPTVHAAKVEDEDSLFGRTVAMKMKQIAGFETKIDVK